MTNILQKYFDTVVRRYDDDGIIKYFDYTDFDGINAEKISFYNLHGMMIRGYIYSCESYDPERIVVFAHGLGGHRSYMREIAYLCAHGYRVLSYDAIGCFESDGDRMYGFTEMLSDLDCCLQYIEATECFNGLKICVIGHSFGGYAAANILLYHPEVYSLTVISGYMYARDIPINFVHDEAAAQAAYEYERELYPEYADADAITALQTKGCHILMIHSIDDTVAPIACGLMLARNNCSNPSIRYAVTNGKQHLPHYTLDAAQYFAKTFGDYQSKLISGELKTDEDKKEFFATVDFMRMTEQDEQIWRLILDNIKG